MALVVLVLVLLGVWVGRMGMRRLGRATGRAITAVRKPPAHGDARMSEAEARALLGVKAGAGPKAVQTAYLRLIRRTHPDNGGTEGLAAMLNAARDLLLQKATGGEGR